VVCPWCFIGKRRLERALELYRSAYPEASAPDLRFHPFELNPDLPPAGVLRRDYYARKFGPEKVAQIYARIQGVGRELDIAFALEEIQKQPNTRRMHVLISLAAGFGLQERVKEAFLCAFFLDALDLTERDNLERIATDAGLPLEGVPFFIFNGCVAVSGAQEPQALLEAMQQALRESAAAANAPEQPAQSSQSAQRV
jgi:predicted DsbA family dithiol-disulfide isomerase